MKQSDPAVGEPSPAAAIRDGRPSSYEEYADYLTELALRASKSLLAHNDADLSSATSRALDGEATKYLRSTSSVQALRENGAFFTNSMLALDAWSLMRETIDSTSIVVDPTCGAGSLLLPAVPDILRVNSNRPAALRLLRGLDISDAYARAAKARLAIAAIAAGHPAASPGDFDVRNADFFESAESLLDGATHVLLNPPYNVGPTPSGCTWSAGSANNAALFAATTVKLMQPGSHLVAILPEVLRIGNRYSRWRDEIEQHGQVLQVLPRGQFDKSTDIHIFLLHLRKGDSADSPGGQFEGGARWMTSTFDDRSEDDPSSWTIVGNHFEISVGTVVPHRHAEEGPERTFVTPKTVRAWHEVASMDDVPKRRFRGKCETGDFVVVRRTSRPGEPYRARPTIISSTSCVAVDNHLMVLRPIAGGLDACRELVDVLADGRTTRWLDKHYRCRHLSVEALRSLPWWTSDRGPCDSTLR